MESIIGIIMLIVMFNMITNLSIRWILLKIKKQPPTINLPISKKLKNNKTPIYELTTQRFDPGYWVQKWEIQPTIENYYNLLMYLIIPIPLDINVFKYIALEHYFLCSKSELLSLGFSTPKDLEIFWEKKYAEHIKYHNDEINKEKKLTTHINKLNKEFKTNKK